jgi:hypothetical protein
MELITPSPTNENIKNVKTVTNPVTNIMTSKKQSNFTSQNYLPRKPFMPSSFYPTPSPFIPLNFSNDNVQLLPGSHPLVKKVTNTLPSKEKNIMDSVGEDDDENSDDFIGDLLKKKKCAIIIIIFVIIPF